MSLCLCCSLCVGWSRCHEQSWLHRLCLQWALVERSFSTKWKPFLSQKCTVFPFSISRAWEEKKKDSSGPRMKICWHSAMFAGNDGGFIVPNPKYFELFRSVFKLLSKSWKVSVKRSLGFGGFFVVFGFFFNLFCVLDVFIFQISLMSSSWEFWCRS